MSHSHAHHHARHTHADPSRGIAGLQIALGLSLGIFAVELIGGLIGGSLALLADAGHMLADVGSLGLALVAAWMAQRPPSGRRTFGWQRAEILAALANGLVLILIVIATVIAAVRRLENPTSVAGGITLAVATIGLLFNIVSGVVLARSGDSLNVRAALAHVVADALSSLGVIVAAVIIIATGWTQADAIASLVIAALILVSAVGIVRESVDVLMEAAPPGLDVEALGRSMAAVDGVVEVHDLHCWTVASGLTAVAAHVTVGPTTEPSLVRRRMTEMLRKHFHIEHTTLQVERAGDERRLLQIEHRPKAG
jgi:cobalt-zinc-cadmium efflux system protein